MRFVLLFLSARALAAAPSPPPMPLGLVALGDDIHVDPASTPEERAQLRRDYADARRRVVEALGPLESEPPVAIYCKTDRCRDAFAGSAHRSRVRLPGEKLAGAIEVPGDRLTLVIVHIDSVADVTTHELVHVEIHARLHGASLPPWFNEGVAASIGGNTPHCDDQTEKGIDDLRRLANNREWSDYTNLRGRLDPTYCQARHELEAWMGRFGRSRLLQLIQAVRDGGSFYSLYGDMLTQPAGPMSTVLMSNVSDLADNRMPFSLALWIRPVESSGVLAHVSSTPAGTGWCTPFLGFNAAHQLVAQVIHGSSPEPSSYTIALSPKPPRLGRWTHVAMTWAPGSFARLYVNGAEVAATPAAGYNTRNATSSMYVTWGSSNIGGGNRSACWQGAIVPGAFKGAMTGMSIYNVALGASEIAKLAAARP
jgi:hypothetical protein